MNSKIESSNLLVSQAGVTNPTFTENSHYPFSEYYLKYGNDEVKMILSNTGVELKKTADDSKISPLDFAKLKLYKITDDTPADTLVSIGMYFNMKRRLSKF